MTASPALPHSPRIERREDADCAHDMEILGHHGRTRQAEDIHDRAQISGQFIAALVRE